MQNSGSILYYICGPSENVALCRSAIYGPNLFAICRFVICRYEVCGPKLFLVTNTWNTIYFSYSNLHKIKKCFIKTTLGMFWGRLCGILTKFADLRFADYSWKVADWHTQLIYGFAKAEWCQKFATLQFAELKKILLANPWPRDKYFFEGFWNQISTFSMSSNCLNFFVMPYCEENLT
jgi:hypothetical protein